uniref:Uncharacterized protein n=1 Tax=Arundo donax TaxID=35708 RepID=A0A0A9GEC4_ARUDO
MKEAHYKQRRVYRAANLNLLCLTAAFF